jgi:hypothetical protein
VEKKAAVVTERIALHKTQKCVSASLDQSFLAAKIIPRATLEITAFWRGSRLHGPAQLTTELSGKSLRFFRILPAYQIFLQLTNNPYLELLNICLFSLSLLTESPAPFIFSRP